MMRTDAARNIHRILSSEGLDDNLSLLNLIVPGLAGDFLRRHDSAARDLAIKIIGMRGPICRDRSLRLRPGRRPRRVCVDDTADLRPRLVQLQMRRHINRWFVIALHNLSIQVHDHHVFRFHGFVRDAARLDDKQSALPVNPGNVSPGEGDKSALWQLHVCFKYLLFQFLQHIQLLFLLPVQVVRTNLRMCTLFRSVDAIQL